MSVSTRRDFLKATAMATGWLAAGRSGAADQAEAGVPPYLRDYAADYRTDPRQAAIRWFREARFGLFLHYGLYSLAAGMWKDRRVNGNAEWLQYRVSIPVDEYAGLKDRFTAAHFDADAIADLAVAARMKYVNITSRHHDSFCLWDTKQTDFNSVNSPAKRDLIAELAEACGKRGLGLCLYYSHGRDWRHPHAPNNDGWGGAARPRYRQPEPHYKTGPEHDLAQYLDFMKAQITELLTGYGPIANIWLDGIGTPLHPKGNNRKEMFHCQELYDHIHGLQPQVLVSYKQGLLGTEDFFAPEHRAAKARVGRPMEICTTLQQGSWGWKQGAPFLKVDQAMAKLANARAVPANLLLNVGPKGDGSVPSAAADVLREMGKRITRDGWPGKTAG